MKRLISLPLAAAPFKAIIGTDNIALITFPSTSTVVITYAGAVTATFKTTITFTNADSTYASHNLVAKAINDTYSNAASPAGIYEMPPLAINTISTVAYA
jgi:hypothetical protein